MSAEDPPFRTVIGRPAAQMTMRAPRWLYDMRIPAGALTLLAGREGIGKSTISADLAALITQGKLPGINFGIPRGVAIAAAEDSWECVILPRLVAAGADLTRVYRVEVYEDMQVDTISLPADLQETARMCKDLDIALLQLDPIMSVLHGSLDTHKDRDVRKALEPLASFCADTDVAALGLIHVNKGTTNDPLNSIMGSRAFAAVARSVLYCIADADDESGESYLFGHPKSNLGPRQPTRQYSITNHRIELEGGETIGTSRVRWGAEDQRTIQDAMEEPRAPRAQGELATRVTDWVTGQGRTVSVQDILAEFPDTKRATLDKTLERLVKRGRLSRPIHGHYTSPSAPVTHRHSDTTSDTLSTPSEESYMSELSDDQKRSDTSDASDALTDVRTPVRAGVGTHWADALYDAE